MRAGFLNGLIRRSSSPSPISASIRSAPFLCSDLRASSGFNFRSPSEMTLAATAENSPHYSPDVLAFVALVSWHSVFAPFPALLLPVPRPGKSRKLSSRLILQYNFRPSLLTFPERPCLDFLITVRS
ncbi:hypothetical protein NL676_032067 [Syzygium grande]|nr:hypothetical protein NL676_032067 [Syzygium grande]